jgi:hypothetical protein
MRSRSELVRSGTGRIEILSSKLPTLTRRKRISVITFALPLIAMLLLSGVALAQTGGPPKPGETPFFDRIDNTYVGSAVRNSNWLFPVIESVHVVGIVFLVGASVLLDLRLLKRGYLREQPLSQAWSRLIPVMWAAFGVMLATGALMLISESWQCYTSIAFRVKMGLLLAVGANVLFFYFAAYQRMRGDANWRLPESQPQESLGALAPAGRGPVSLHSAAALESEPERSIGSSPLSRTGEVLIPSSAKFCAWASMILWVLIVFAGRFIAYW